MVMVMVVVRMMHYTFSWEIGLQFEGDIEGIGRT